LPVQSILWDHIPAVYTNYDVNDRVRQTSKN
jgi:hypothetical protein